MNTPVSVLILMFAMIFFFFIGFHKSMEPLEFSNEPSKSNDNLQTVNEESKNKLGNNINSKFYDNKDTINENNIKKYEDLVKTINNYVQRYVSLFLIASNLRDYEIKNLNEDILVDLEISITGKDLSYLQSFSKNTKNSSYFKNLSKLDAIFSKIARLKQRSYTENTLKYLLSSFASSNFFSIINTNFYFFLSFLITSLLTWVIHRYIFHKSFFVFLGLTLNSLILWESFNEYWKRIKNADVEIFYKTMDGMPAECNPANVRWYHSLLNYFTGDRCLQYYKNLQKTAIEEVSLFQCIFNTYFFYIFRTPIKILGSGIRDFTEEISALFPQPIRFFINFPLILFSGCFIAVFILILLQKRFRLSFFGISAAIESDSRKVSKTERLSLTSCEVPKTILHNRNLKPWTRSRFPKRLDIVGKRKKIFLMAPRSESSVPSETKQICTDSSAESTSKEIKHD